MAGILAAIGFVGILLYLVAEVLQWKGRSSPARLAAGSGACLAVSAHLLALVGPRVGQGPPALASGMLALAAAAYLLYRSLWAELPRGAWMPPAHGTVPRLTVRKGTYALARHPGWWWHGLFLAGLYLVSGSLWLRAAAPWWWLANLILVTVEDCWLYPRLFADYGDYRRRVPFLLPTLASLAACRRTWREDPSNPPPAAL